MEVFDTGELSLVFADLHLQELIIFLPWPEPLFLSQAF